MPLFNHLSEPRRSSIHIHDIPSEILSQIFIGTYPSSIFEPDSKVSSAESILLPRRLSHVCRRWREEALSFGELWSYLCLTKQDIQRDHQRTLDIFRTFLDRSNVSPLNFRFRYRLEYNHVSFPPPCDNEGELSTLVTITSALLNNQHRWQTVYFTWAFFEVPPHFPKIEIFNIPLVKSLSVYVDLHDSKPFPAFIDLTRSPHLESLDLRGQYKLSIGQPNYGVLECQLWPSCLSGNEAAKDCSYMLKLAPNLRSMVYNTGSEHPSERTYDVEPPESHPLKELYIYWGCSQEQILDSVHLPELETLLCGPGVLRGRALMAMIQRSRPPLTSLQMPSIPCGTLLGILCLLPTLVELRTTIYRGEDVMFRALQVESALHDSLDGDEPVLCPQLRDLRLHLMGGWSEEAAEALTSVLFTMLDSRMINLGTFNKVFYLEHSHCSEPNLRVEVSLQPRDHGVVKRMFSDGGNLSIETSR